MPYGKQIAMKHIDGKTLLKAMDMIKRGEKSAKVTEMTGLQPDQVAELKRRARER